MIDIIVFFLCVSLLFSLLVIAEGRKIIKAQDKLIADLRRTIDRLENTYRLPLGVYQTSEPIILKDGESIVGTTIEKPLVWH